MKHFAPITYLFLSIFLLLLTAVFSLRPDTVQAGRQPNASADFDCTQVMEIPQTECEALVALYNATDGSNWTNQTDWLVTNTPCSWYGVSCSEDYIDDINLNSNRLSGDLPSEIGNLINLMWLNLGSNKLASVPPEIGSLANLKWLDLDGNQLTTLPPEIVDLVNLIRLNLGSNQLTAVPPEIFNLSILGALMLNSNQLTVVPSEIGNLSNLTHLDLSNNQLTTLPPEIFNLTNLGRLNLDQNLLTTIPPEIGNLVNLWWLDLGENMLTSVPPEISALNLILLNLTSNRLTSIPPEIGDIEYIEFLSLSGNQLTSVPSEIGNLSYLDFLGLSYNQLTTVPPELENLSNLTYLGLNKNQLVSVPPEIGNLPNLTYLYLHNNQLTAVPPEIGNLSNLTYLHLRNNSLTGAVPSSLTSLTQLSSFSFYDTGWCIPDETGIQTWLAGITDVYGTGRLCGQPVGALNGVVKNAQGTALSNAQVILYRSAPIWPLYRSVVSSTHTNESGKYSFDGLGQDIDYYVQFQDGDGVLAPEYHENKGTLETADPVTITLGVTRTLNAQLNIAHPPLVTVGLGSGSASSSINSVDGTIHVTAPNGRAADVTLTYAAACEDGGTPSAVVLNYNDQPYPMTADGGSYQATIPAADVTESADITITTTCGGEDADVTVGSITLYDPSGIISNATTQEPIADAKVTLYQVPGWQPRNGASDTRPNTCESNTSKPESEPWSQPAPTDLGIPVNTELTTVAPLVGHQFTNDAGSYGWDVPTGCWYVVVEADGYDTLVSPVVGVPPAVLDLNLILTPTMQYVYLPMIIR